MLIVGQKITFQPNLAYQRQIIPIHTRFYGGAFQGGSGERLHGMQEVTGSIPVFSTNQEQGEHFKHPSGVRGVRFVLSDTIINLQSMRNSRRGISLHGGCFVTLLPRHCTPFPETARRSGSR